MCSFQARKKARAFWRKHTLEDDPIFLAKQKLKAAAYGYKNDWGGLYAAIDRDGSGSLDQVRGTTFRPAQRGLSVIVWDPS